jgi:hypothetical protein
LLNIGNTVGDQLLPNETDLLTGSKDVTLVVVTVVVMEAERKYDILPKSVAALAGILGAMGI